MNVFFSGNGPLLAFEVENPHHRTHKSVVIPVVKNLLQISIMSSRKKVFSLKKKFCWLYSSPISFHSWWELDWGKYVFFLLFLREIAHNSKIRGLYLMKLSEREIEFKIYPIFGIWKLILQKKNIFFLKVFEEWFDLFWPYGKCPLGALLELYLFFPWKHILCSNCLRLYKCIDWIHNYFSFC